MTLADFKELNKKIGHFWFSPDTMAFFKTKIHDWNPRTGVFITSEVNPSGDKRYSVRLADFETGKVKTVSDFHSIRTLEGARKWIKENL